MHCVVIMPLHNPLESDKTTHTGFIIVLTTTARTQIDSAATPLWKNLLRADTAEQKLTHAPTETHGNKM